MNICVIEVVETIVQVMPASNTPSPDLRWQSDNLRLQMAV